MRLIKLNTWAVRHGLMLLCASLLVSGCGLASGRSGLDAGLKYQASGQYRAAYIEAKKVLQRDNKNGDAWLLLGQASLLLGDPQSALNDLQNAQANGVAEARWAIPMGRALLVTHQYDKLLETLSPAKPFEPKVKVRADVLRGDAYFGLKQLDQAKQSYQAALALEPKDPGALVGLAKLTSADADAAGNYVQQALVAAPENPQALVMRGDLAFDRGNFVDAEADYQKVLGLKHPDWLPQERFYTLSRLANVQAQQNRLDQALATIQTLEKMSPRQPYPHYLRAVVLYKQGQLDDAVSELQQVLQASPDNAQAQMLMGTINYAQGNYGQAEMALSNVMGVDPKNVEARKLLALTFYREGRSRQALDTLRPALSGGAVGVLPRHQHRHDDRGDRAGAAAPPGRSAGRSGPPLRASDNQGRRPPPQPLPAVRSTPGSRRLAKPSPVATPPKPFACCRRCLLAMPPSRRDATACWSWPT